MEHIVPALNYFKTNLYFLKHCFLFNVICRVLLFSFLQIEKMYQPETFHTSFQTVDYFLIFSSAEIISGTFDQQKQFYSIYFLFGGLFVGSFSQMSYFIKFCREK